MNRSQPYRTISNKSVALILFFIILLLKLPIINVPYSWDVLAGVIPGAFWIYQHRLLPLLGPFDFGHPPLYQEILAIIWSIFGYSIWITHLVTIIFSFAGVYFTYLLGTELKDKKVGVLAALLLFFSPLYFAQSGILNLEIPSTAFTVITAYFALKENSKLYVISGICLVMTKSPGLLLILCLFVYKIFQGYKKPKEVLLRSLLIYSLPFIFFLGWLSYHKWGTGWVLYPRNFTYQVNELWFNLYQRVKDVFLVNPGFFILFGAFFYVILMKRDRLKKSRPAFLLFIAFIFLCLLVFSSHNIYLSRYVLITYPFCYLLGVYCLVEISEDRNRILIVAATVLIFLSISNWYGHRIAKATGSGAILESNLEYLDLIATHKLAVKFIEQNYPQSIVLTDWPQQIELSSPIMGYVKAPIRWIYFADLKKGLSPQADLVYYSDQSHEAFEMQEFMSKLNLKLLKSYNLNGKSAAIYKIIKN